MLSGKPPALHHFRKITPLEFDSRPCSDAFGPSFPISIFQFDLERADTFERTPKALWCAVRTQITFIEVLIHAPSQLC